MVLHSDLRSSRLTSTLPTLSSDLVVLVTYRSAPKLSGNDFPIHNSNSSAPALNPGLFFCSQLISTEILTGMKMSRANNRRNYLSGIQSLNTMPCGHRISYPQFIALSNFSLQADF